MSYKPYHSDEESSMLLNSSSGVGSRAAVSDDEAISYNRRRRPQRQRVSATGAASSSGWHSLDEYTVSRDEAMMEGSRMLIDSLKEKVADLENRCGKLEREKSALGDLLGARKRELLEQEEDFEREIEAFEERCSFLESENRRLVERMKLPEGQRFNLVETENKITKMEKELKASGINCAKIEEENKVLRQEISDLKLEIDEMHDQFREDEAMEFREIQKDLEATAKNCRILQFKLRKAERRNEQQEVDKIRYEEQIKQLEGRFDNLDDRQQHVRELEEELKMAKEVSVRLHDELEQVEEQRIVHEQEKRRLQDYIDESESRRTALQQETEELHSQVEILTEKLSESRKANGSSPIIKSKQFFSSKDSTDIEKLMRELSDSLERENDVKEQFRFAEEEIRMMRKKVSEVEQENESLDAQLHKMSAAKSSRFLSASGGGGRGGKGDEVVTEREHDLRIEIELAEEEVKILKRKNDELETENERLMSELEFLQDLLLKRSSSTQSGGTGAGGGGVSVGQPHGVDERTDEEKIQAMALDIDELKWKLMEKERIVDRRARKDRADEPKKKAFLQKSRSLDSDHNMDLRKQLDLVQQEAALLRERISRLETENDKLSSENKKLHVLATRNSARLAAAGGGGAAGTTADSQAERIRQLEAENSALQSSVNQTGKSTPTTDVTGARDTEDRLRTVEEENVSLRRKMAAAETQADRLKKQLEKMEDDNKIASEEQLIEEQKSKISDLEREIKDLLGIVKNREEENERLEEEIDEYRQDIDKMMDMFRLRESDLMEEIESVQQKNNVLSNLLDLVTERAESTQKELERITHDTNITCSRSDTRSGTETRSGADTRSASVVSAVSDVSVGSDEVFLSSSAETRERDKNGVPKEWEDQFIKRINCLERLLVEERLKVHAAEKRETFKDVAPSIIMEDSGIHNREKSLLRKELALCERQLTDANEQIGDLKERLANFEIAHDNIKKDFEQVCGELDIERNKKGPDSAPATPPTTKLNKSGRSSSLGSLSGAREPASWRWEKQEYERQIRDMKKKTDELHRQLQRAQIKWKMAGGDEKAKAEKEKLEKDLKAAKEECETYKDEINELTNNIKQLQDKFAKKESQWEKDKSLLESERKASQKEAQQKQDIIREKDSIISHKDDLIREKENIIAEQQSTVERAENSSRQHAAEISKRDKALQQAEKTAEQLKIQIVQKEDAVKEKEKRIKDLDERLRVRDQRLKEKDEIMEKLNRTARDREADAVEAKNKHNEALKKLHENEIQYRMVDEELKSTREILNGLKAKVKEAEKQLEQQETQHSKELNNLIIQRDSAEEHLEKLRDDKQSVDEELRILREQLSLKSSVWEREETRLTEELAHTRDCLANLEKTRTIEQNETITGLRKEKSDLLNERQALRDDVTKLRAEMNDNNRKWSTEKADLITKMGERNKLVDDKLLYCKKLEGNIKALKQQLAEKVESSEQVIRSHIRETIPLVDVQEMKAQLERQELFFRAEKVSIEDLYENKMRLLHEELNILKEKAASLKTETNMQKELLNETNRIIMDLKNKHANEESSWSKERHTNQREIRELIAKTIMLGRVEKNLSDVRRQLADQKTETTELKTMAATQTAGWDLERAKLQSQIRKLEDPGLQSRFKFMEKKDNVFEKETKKAHTEAEKKTKELRQQLKTLRADQEQDRKELKSRLDNLRSENLTDLEKIQDYKKKLDQRTQQVSELQNNLLDSQYRLTSDKEAWLRERSELQRQLTDSRNSHLMDQQKITDLLAQTRKLQVLAPSFDTERLDREATPNSLLGDGSDKRHTSSTLIELSSSHGRSMSRASSIDSTAPEYDQIPLDPNFQEALQHILQLADELKSTETKIERQMSSLAPPSFRRSLSTSEVELTQEWAAYAEAPAYPTRQYGGSGGGAYSSIPKTSLSTVSSHTASTGATSPGSSNDDDVMVGGDYNARARPVMRRSFSSSVEPKLTTTTSTGSLTSTSVKDSPSGGGAGSQYGGGNASGSGRPSRQNTITRSSIYASGSQSAYGSRDASPDKYFRFKKLSPYPVPPPSFIVTPPKTPRGKNTAPQLLTSENMAKLYEKLGAIERQGEDSDVTSDDMMSEDERSGSRTRTISGERSEAIARERTNRLRVLTKSTSVDHGEDTSRYLPTSHDHTRSHSSSGAGVDDRGSLSRSGDHLDATSSVYDDADISQSLPASLVVGGLVITPGIQRFDVQEQQRQQYSDRKPSRKVSPSPATVRRNFYDNYATERTGRAIEIRTEAGVAASSKQTESSKSTPTRIIKAGDNAKKIPVTHVHTSEPAKPSGSGVATPSKDKDTKSKSSITPFWVTSVKEKRKLFSSKKSNSVDTSTPVQSTLAQIGAKVLSGVAAPSTYDPATSQKKEGSGDKHKHKQKAEPSERRRKFFHRRAQSMDASMMTKIEPRVTVQPSINPAFDSSSSIRHSGKR